VALVSRDLKKLEPLTEKLRKESKVDGAVHGFAADATKSESVNECFAQIKAKLGPVSVLVYNAGFFAFKSILDITPEAFKDAWDAGCFGGFLTLKAALPDMLKAGHGTIIFSGATASLRGGANFSLLSVGKFGLRSLAQSAAREFSSKGIHISHVIIDGQIGPDSTSKLDPDALAENYWHLHTQHKSAWTFEMDLRPYVEKW